MSRTSLNIPESIAEPEIKNHPLPAHNRAKPFLKWAGGKGQLIENFQLLFPIQLKEEKIKFYHEPFLGSGAVFFNIAQQFKIEKAFLSDINEDLILTYLVVQRDVSKLIELLEAHQRKFEILDKGKRQNYFYDQRSEFNSGRFKTNYGQYSESWFPRAAQFIFLNRTCFNGLYRVNSKGEFNSPAGDYENPSICDKQNLMAVNKVLAIAEIRKASYKEVINDLTPDSFTYFDPPYRPISKTASFKAYSEHDFSDGDQVQLANVFEQIDALGAKVMLSNSDPKNHNPDDDFFDDLYHDYNIVRIPARRMINSDATKRGAINEIVVTNYTKQA